MTSSIITNRIKVNIASGSNAQSDYVTLEKGRCIGVYFLPFGSYEPENAVEISLRDPQGNVIINPVDYRDFKHKGGGYVQGMKQVNFECNNNKFQVSVLSDTALTGDFKGELVLLIQRDCLCDNNPQQ